ncbi:MAG: hypothetical protein KR126chlam1_00610 [Chlamydiae bacterium]|nr:hypothetical protein [Chlamydiota bacterium]
MESALSAPYFDLVTPDAIITNVHRREKSSLLVDVQIETISSAFVGFSIDQDHLFFNLKSTLAQVGVHSVMQELELQPKSLSAQARIKLVGLNHLGTIFIKYLKEGAYIGKLFAADPRRKVQNPDYLLRMFGRTDRDGLPLLSLDGGQGSRSLHLEKVDGRTIATLRLQKGVITYDKEAEHFLPTLAKALHHPNIKSRELVSLNQRWVEGGVRNTKKDPLLLIKTLPLHIRTAYAKVVDELLPQGMQHTSANVLQPDTMASGDVYEVYGSSKEELTHLPLEFYTLEPYREHVFFTDRDQLQSSLENTSHIFQTFDTVPKKERARSSVFIVKGSQMQNLTEEDWITRKVHPEAFPGLYDIPLQSQLVQEYIKQQPTYPFLKAIESGIITSQGVLFSQYFPSPLMKKMLLGDLVQSSLKGIYFQTPSQTYGNFFSHEDRSLLLDLAKFAIPVFWVDRTCGKVLQFALKPEKDTGMFVPIPLYDQFVKSTSFGVYGSTLLELRFEKELTLILEGILEMKKSTHHPLLSKETPLALITGGGPGLMAVGNHVARKLQILSCANIVDFRHSETVEQHENPYIDAKMTYRLDKLVERQAEFNLDFPIIMMGGIGTDFEFSLEEVRRKVGIGEPTPILLLGPTEFWREKITARFQVNLKNGTIAGSEWVSNCFYAVQNASEALKVYQKYFSGTLPIGKGAPPAKEGFHKL